jgi:hypothetical protein
MGVVTVSGYTVVASNNLNAVMDALVTKGPLAIAVAADNWKYYGGGVFDMCNYDKNVNINHGV